MIPDLKGLERLLKLCRKQGVTELTCEGLSLKLGEIPGRVRERGGKRAAAAAESPSEGVYVPGVGMIPPGMTPEEFMYMSSPGPQPSEG